jgi:hypothetical protein
VSANESGKWLAIWVIARRVAAPLIPLLLGAAAMALLLDSGTVHLPPIRAGAGSGAAPTEKVVVSPPAVHRTHHRAVAHANTAAPTSAATGTTASGVNTSGVNTRCQHIADPGRRCSAAGRHRREACVAAEAEGEAADDRQDRRSSPADRRAVCAVCAARCRWRAPQASEASEAGEDASRPEGAETFRGAEGTPASGAPPPQQAPQHPQHPSTPAPQHPQHPSTPSIPSTPSVRSKPSTPSRRSGRSTSTPTRTARRRATCTTSRLDWQRGRTAPSPTTRTVARAKGMTRVRTAAKVTARTAGATTTEPRAAPGVSARTRPPSAVDAHPDGDRDLPDRVGLLRDRPGRGAQRHAHHRLPGTRRRPERSGSVCPEPRPAAGTRRRGSLVCASAGRDPRP